MTKPFYTVVCDDTNNGYGEELAGVVCADFRFDGVKGTYRVEVMPSDSGVPFAQFRQTVMERLPKLLQQYSDQEVANSVQQLYGQYSQVYGRKVR